MPGQTPLDPNVYGPLHRYANCCHCAVEWDGDESSASAVTITDLSHGKIWINGERVQSGGTRIIRNYNIVKFGSGSRSPQSLSFMFRHYHAQSSSESHFPPELRRDYDLQLSLGRGAYATVVKALHVHEKRWYAVKLISRHAINSVRGRLGGGRDEVTMEDLRKEIDVLSRLRHRYIVQFKEAVYGDRSVGIVMEFVPGGDLGAYMDEHGLLQEAQVKRFTYQICKALAYLHREGIVHRDLKPENVLMTNDEPRTVKLADFGLAKAVHSMTCLRTRCGTPLYMAPEVSDQTVEGYTKAVDSWSLGVMVCVMLWGRSPFLESSKKVNWDFSQKFGTSALGEGFLRCLLTLDPQERMSPDAARRHPWLSTKRRRIARPALVPDERASEGQRYGSLVTSSQAAAAIGTWNFPHGRADVVPDMRERGVLLQKAPNNDNGAARPLGPSDRRSCFSSAQSPLPQAPSTPPDEPWLWPPIPIDGPATISSQPPTAAGPSGYAVQEANPIFYGSTTPFYDGYIPQPGLMTSSGLRTWELSSAPAAHACEAIASSVEPSSPALGSKRLIGDETNFATSTTAKRARASRAQDAWYPDSSSAG